jgi:predicted DNA-binding protein
MTRKDVMIFVRVDPDLRERFRQKSEAKSMTMSIVLREMIEAFCEDRVTIYAPEGKENFYVTRS